MLTVSEGSYLLENDLGRETLLPDQVALIPANTMTDFIHHDGPEGEMHASWLHFRFSLYGLVDFLTLFETPMRLPSASCSRLCGIIQEAGKRPFDGLESLARLHALASEVLVCLLEVSRRREDAWRFIEQSRLRPVLQHIQANLSKRLTVDDLARIAGVSPSRFHALFLADFGCSPMRYVKRQRLEAAAQQLAGCDAKLHAIASMTGFADAFHLSHAFKAYFGVSPKAYRQQSRDWTPKQRENAIPANI